MLRFQGSWGISGKSGASVALFLGVSLQQHDMVTVMGCLTLSVMFLCWPGTWHDGVPGLGQPAAWLLVLSTNLASLVS